MTRSRNVSTLALAFVAGACGGRTSDTNDNNRPPDPNAALTAFSANITRPRGTGTYLVGETIRFQASFAEGDYAVEPESMTWTSSIDGDLGTTNPLDIALTQGTHTIEVAGTFNGHTADDTLSVEVTDFAVRISSPRDGGDSTVGEVVFFDFVAGILDANDTPLTLTPMNPDATFVWSSDIDGEFTPMAYFYNGLTLGTHVITLTVTYAPTDVAPRTASASVTLIVHEPNHDPVASIDAPADCPDALVEQGTATTFTGSVTDVDAWDTELVGSWVDSVYGHPTEGDTFVLPASAALGLHQVTFSVTDTYGDSDSVTCDVYVVEPGSDRSSLFPDTATITAALLNGETDLRFVGADPAGTVWIGSVDGVTIFNGEPPGVYENADIGLPGTEMLLRDVAFYDGGAALATAAGLTFCGYADGVLSACTAIDVSGPNNYFAVDESAGIVAAAADGGLVLATSSDPGASVLFTEGADSLPSDGVRDVLFADGVLYVATDDGVCIIDDAAAALASPSSTLCSTVLQEDGIGMWRDNATALADGGDVIWIGTSGGLMRYYPATGASVRYDEHNFGDERINDIAVDADGIVWVATHEGVTRLDPSINVSTEFSGTDLGLPSSFVRSIYIDADGTKWFAGDGGLVQYIGA